MVTFFGAMNNELKNNVEQRTAWEAGAHLATGYLNILNINVDGLRTKQQRLALLQVLSVHRIDIGILTETHLRRKDLKRIHFRGYKILGESCRSTRRKIGGGRHPN